MVLHKGEVTDISRTNIVLGTAHDNAMDVPEVFRKQRGQAAGFITAQLIRSLTDTHVRTVREMLRSGMGQTMVSN